MLARTCLLAGEKTNSMSSVIRLLDQTYQRLLCDENNPADKNNSSNVKNNNKMIKEQNHDMCKNDDGDDDTKLKMHASPQTLINANNATIVNGTETSTTASTTASSLQNELSSTSSSVLSASSSHISNEAKHVKNQKVDKILILMNILTFISFLYVILFKYSAITFGSYIIIILNVYVMCLC